MREQTDLEKDEIYKQIGQLKGELDLSRKELASSIKDRRPSSHGMFSWSDDLGPGATALPVNCSNPFPLGLKAGIPPTDRYTETNDTGLKRGAVRRCHVGRVAGTIPFTGMKGLMHQRALDPLSFLLVQIASPR
jgi:hypothetical protein